MRALIACEFSGIVRDAFRALGHDAMSCDLEPSERPGPHYQGDVRDVLGDGWDLLIGFPPCTYLSRAGARWWGDPVREALALEALAFVRLLWDAPIPRVALENPIGRLNSWWRYPDQVIEPWHFGDPYTKRTCLWLRGVPPLMATHIVGGRVLPWVQSNTGLGRRRGQNWHPGVARKVRDLSRTFPGVANAMASQWSSLVPALVAA